MNARTNYFKTLTVVTVLSLGISFSVNAQNWLLAGNPLTSTSNFIGTTSTATFKDLVFKTNSNAGNNERMRILGSNGNIGIGLASTVPALGRLDIKGSGSNYLNCFNLVDNGSVAKTSMLHSGGSFYLGMATAASLADASGDFTRRLRIYEPTTTGTNTIIQLGDGTNQNAAMLHNGNFRIGIGTDGNARLAVFNVPNIVNDPAVSFNGTQGGILKRFFVVPALTAGAYNYMALNGDFGIFCNDGTGAIGKNGSGGIVIAPHADAFSGIRIDGSGKVQMGNVNINTATSYRLYVETGILTEKVKVALINTSDWSDYVFEKNYKLKPLDEVESFIEKNKHLPGIPSACELVDQGGFDLGKMDAKLLEKIEELTLYMIELKKENKNLTERLSKLEAGK